MISVVPDVKFHEAGSLEYRIHKNRFDSNFKLGYPDTWWSATVYPKKYAHGFCFVVLCCGYTLTDFPISIRLTSLALWQSNDCPSANKATLMNMDKYFMWIHYERLHNHNKAKHNKTVCIFLGIYIIYMDIVLSKIVLYCAYGCVLTQNMRFESYRLLK